MLQAKEILSLQFHHHKKVSRKVTLCFILLCGPYPLFQWYLQSKEILLNLGMKCWNSPFNAQGLRVIIVVVQVGAVKIYVAAQCRRSGKRKHRMKLSLPPKLVGKLVWVPVISFCKIFIPSYAFDALLCRNWPFLPPNRLTLPITLITHKIFITYHKLLLHHDTIICNNFH